MPYSLAGSMYRFFFFAVAAFTVIGGFPGFGSPATGIGAPLARSVSTVIGLPIADSGCTEIGLFFSFSAVVPLSGMPFVLSEGRIGGGGFSFLEEVIAVFVAVCFSLFGLGVPGLLAAFACVIAIVFSWL